MNFEKIMDIDNLLSSDYPRFQSTIKKTIKLSSIALHNGLKETIILHPAEDGSGIYFFKKGNVSDIISAKISNVVSTKNAINLSNGRWTINTVEHLLSACYIFQIDNLAVEVFGDEIPFMDGSAGQFVSSFCEVGKLYQNSKREYIRLLKPLSINSKDSFAKLIPFNGFSVESDIVFGDIINQKLCISQNNFIEKISSARTFVLEEDIDKLKSINLIKGGSLDNAVVFTKDGVLNKEGLRFSDEAVRHKILDIIGAFALIGNPILCKYEGYKCGHFLHAKLLNLLLGSR